MDHYKWGRLQKNPKDNVKKNCSYLDSLTVNISPIYFIICAYFLALYLCLRMCVYVYFFSDSFEDDIYIMAFTPKYFIVFFLRTGIFTYTAVTVS